MGGNIVQPIASYKERTFERRHRFDLFPASIRVSGSTPAKRVETTIQLAQLDASVTRVWIYSLWFYVGCWLFMAGIVGFLAVVAIIEAEYVPEVSDRLMKLAVGIASAGALALAVNSRKIEYAQFQSSAGVPVFAIAKSGRVANEFDRFVALLAVQIGVAKSGIVVEGLSPENNPAAA